MSEILTNNKYYSDIADTIRQMKGVATTYKPREMAGALRDMYSTEVEGVPPLTFPSNGNNLLNYRIDGANGGVGDRTENLFDFGEWSKNINANRDNSLAKGIDGITITANSNDAFTIPYSYAHNGAYKIYVKPNTNYLLSWVSNNNLYGRVIIFKNGISDNTHMVSANNNTTKYLLFGTDADTEFITLRFGVETTGDTITYSKIMLNEGSTALPYEPYGYKIPVVISGKNLLQNTATTQTINGITVTVNDDKSISLSGTSSELTYVDINTNFNSSELAGYYLKLIFPENYVSATSSMIVRISSQNSRTSLQDFTTTKLINDNGNNNRLSIRINGNYTIPDNFKLYLMVSQNSNDNYEPYIEPTTTNIYLDEPIEVNESKSLSDTNVNIPTINGTNILSVNTTVQPSKVYVQAPKTNGDYNIKVDTSNNISDNWYGLMAYITEIGNIDTSNIINMGNMFCGCQMITEIPLLNTQNVTDMSGMFVDCLALTTVPLLNTQNVTNMSDVFYGCPELTNESLNNVLKMCINAVEITSNKTLNYIGLSQAQATTCATLSNYQDFLNAGWTTGY